MLPMQPGIQSRSAFNVKILCDLVRDVALQTPSALLERREILWRLMDPSRLANYVDDWVTLDQTIE